MCHAFPHLALYLFGVWETFQEVIFKICSLISQGRLELCQLGIYQRLEGGKLRRRGCKSTKTVDDLPMLIFVAKILEGTSDGLVHLRWMKRSEVEDDSVDGSRNSRRGLNALKPTRR